MKGKIFISRKNKQIEYNDRHLRVDETYLLTYLYTYKPADKCNIKAKMYKLMTINAKYS